MKNLLITLVTIILFSCKEKVIFYEKPFVIIHKYSGTYKISYSFQDRNGNIINFQEYKDKKEYFIGDTIK